MSLSSVRKEVRAEEVLLLSSATEDATGILISHDSLGVAGLGSSTWYQVRPFLRPCLSEVGASVWLCWHSWHLE